MSTQTTTTVTIGRETRTVTLEVFANDVTRAAAPVGTFVGSVGAGRATYPAQPTFWLQADGTWRMGGVVIRNRQGRVTGFADTRPVTNYSHQERV